MLSVPRLLREPRDPVTAMPLMPRSRPGNYDPTRSPNCTSPSSATSHSLCALSPAWHPATLPRNISIFMDQGVVYNGNIARLRSLRHSRRNPLVVAAFGASMTAEHGGRARHLHGCRCAHPGLTSGLAAAHHRVARADLHAETNSPDQRGPVGSHARGIFAMLRKPCASRSFLGDHRGQFCAAAATYRRSAHSMAARSAECTSRSAPASANVHTRRTAWPFTPEVLVEQRAQ